MTVASISKDSSSTAEKTDSSSRRALDARRGENSVYRIAPDGAVREIFREKAQMLSLLKVKDKLLVGTGMDGRLFEVNETTREFAEIARPDVGQIVSPVSTGRRQHCGRHRRRWARFRFARRRCQQRDCGFRSIRRQVDQQMGDIPGAHDVPSGSGLSVAVRGGNTSEPDSTWSDWSAEFGNPAKAIFGGPACRFARFRVTLRSENGKTSPTLHTVSLRYATVNQAPEVTSLETPDLDAAPQKEPKKAKIKWTATDANEDELTFDIFVRKDGWADWVRIEENYGKSEYEWDTTTTPSGVYRVKIVASDRTDNAESEALTGSRVRRSDAGCTRSTGSETETGFGRKRQGNARSHGLCIARSAERRSYAIDGKSWINVFPVDGLFDGKEKTFRFQTEALGAGAHVIVLRVKDVAANVGTGDVVFTVGKK